MHFPKHKKYNRFKAIGRRSRVVVLDEELVASVENVQVEDSSATHQRHIFIDSGLCNVSLS